MKRLLKLLVVGAPLVLMLAQARPAEAKLFEVWGQVHTGYGYGTGNGDNDFYRWVRGAVVGGEVGVKILFFGVFIDYAHYLGGDNDADLLTFNLMLFNWNIELSDSWSLGLRVAGGYYHGILPDSSTIVIDNVEVDQVNTRGIGARAGLDLRYSFSKVFGIGITAQPGIHYFLGGVDESVTDTVENSFGFDLTALAYFRLGLGF